MICIMTFHTHVQTCRVAAGSGTLSVLFLYFQFRVTFICLQHLRYIEEKQI
jgi:hypothetical protein